jgi:6-phosphogluconolactonase (cycloisomerase 2 family)
MILHRLASLLLPTVLLASGCGSGSGSGSSSAPKDLTYAENPAVYTQGFAIAPNLATVTGTITAWSVLPALPAGLGLGVDGEITGTPLATLAPTDFTVTASNALGSTSEDVTISVLAPQPRALYVANLTDNTVGSFHVEGLIHSGYAISSGTSPRALAARPDGAFVYAADNASSHISTFAVDPVAGTLTITGAPVASGAQPSALLTDLTGTFLFSADLGAGSISTFTIDAGVPVAGPTATTGTEPAALALAPGGGTLYVANAGSDDVERFSIDALTGALTSGGAVAAGDQPRGLAVATTPAGSFLYAANGADGTIGQWSIDPGTGALTPLVPATVAAGTDPRGIVAHPAGTFLYVANRGSDTLGLYAIDQSTGVLSPLGTPTVASGVGPSALAVDPTADSLYVCTEFDREVSEYAIALDGTLTLLTSVRTRGNPTDILLGPAEQALQISSNHVYTSATGSGGNVGQFAVDLAAPDLVELSPASVATADAGPRGVAVHPGGTLGLATSENGSNISIFTRDPVTGLLSLAGMEVISNTTDVQFELTGRFAYATQRLAGVQPFAVDVALADLTPLTLANVGVDPRNFDIDPTGQFLYLADTVTGLFMFRITATTGELLPQGSIAAGAGTVNVAVHPSGRWTYAANANGNSISQYAIDGADGTLTALVPPAISTGATMPIGLGLSPDGANLYVSYSATDQVARYSIDQTTGLLTFETAQDTFTPQPQSVDLDATGAMVVVGAFGGAGALSIYSRNPLTGALTLAAGAMSDGPVTAITFSFDLE